MNHLPTYGLDSTDAASPKCLEVIRYQRRRPPIMDNGRLTRDLVETIEMGATNEVRCSSGTRCLRRSFSSMALLPLVQVLRQIRKSLRYVIVTLLFSPILSADIVHSHMRSIHMQ